MSLGLYMDVHVQQQITNGLRLRGIDVLTAQEDSAADFDDDLPSFFSCQLDKHVLRPTWN